MPPSDALALLHPALRTSMEQRGYVELTRVQQAVAEHVDEKRNLRISSVTGSGKTVALGIALASQFTSEPAAGGATGPGAHPEVLVITPTRELAIQVRGELEWLYADLGRVTIEAVTGGTSVAAERRALARRPRLVVATPGRLLDHIRSGAIDCSGVRHVVLDEADQMLDMGFRDDLDAIVDALPEDRQSHLVSATFPPGVRQLADRFQKDAVVIEGTALGVANEDIEHIAIRVRPGDRYAALVNHLLTTLGQRTLVFVRRRVDTADLSARLAGDGFSVLPLSGDLPQAQRVRTLEAFRSGIVNIIIATDVAARGIDVADIGTVIHGDPPDDPDVYVHRSGRTGRAGRKGQSVLIVPTPAERRIRALLSQARIEAEWQSPLSADKTRRAISKQTRRRLHEHLASRTPTEAELTYAARLLAEHDPPALVAALLDLSAPALPRQPMSPEAVRGQERPGPRGRDHAFVRFRLTWGGRAGATPERVLSHVCRRGHVDRGHVGAIDIDPEGTSVEIRADVAVEFEATTRRPDPRDPTVRIVREDRGARGATSGNVRKAGRGQGRRPNDRRPKGRPRSTHRGK